MLMALFASLIFGFAKTFACPSALNEELLHELSIAKTLLSTQRKEYKENKLRQVLTVQSCGLCHEILIHTL